MLARQLSKKIFTRVLNKRALNFVKSKLSPSQNGFIRGCQGPLFVLSEVVRNSLAHGRKLAVIAVDLKKAFDSVSHPCLWYQVHTIGIGGKLFTAMRALYDNVFCSVMINGEKTRKFHVQQGVLQGDPLSTTLFLIYINSLLETIQSLNLGVRFFLGEHEISEFILTDIAYADDFTATTTDLDNVQPILDAIRAWSRKWRILVNIPKTVVMIVGSTKEDRNRKYFFGDSQISIKRSAKTLGVIFNDRGTWKDHVNYVLDRARKAQHNIAFLLKNYELDVDLRLEFWRSKVLSIIVNAGEMWTPNKSDMRKMEAFQTTSLKNVLGCPVGTADAAVWFLDTSQWSWPGENFGSSEGYNFVPRVQALWVQKS